MVWVQIRLPSGSGSRWTEAYHSFRSINAVLVSSFAASRTVLLVLLAVLLLLLFLCRCRSALGALCGRRGRPVIFKLNPGTTDMSEKRQASPGGFLRMNVQSLCLVSSMPRFPQALQEVPIVCFLGLTCCKDKLKEIKSVHFEPSRVWTLCYIKWLKILI